MSFQPYAPPPPPPMPQLPAQHRVPVWAWGFVAAGVLGVVGAILPWFEPTLGGENLPGETVVHSWNDGRIGLLGPLLMLIAAIRWAMGLVGRSSVAVTKRGRRSGNDLRSAAIFSTVSGAITLGLIAIAYGLVPSNYKDWDQAQAFAKEQGVSLGRGPQSGFWLVGFAGLVFLALGVLGLTQFRKSAHLVAYAPPLPYGQPAYGAPVGPPAYGAPAGQPAYGAPAGQPAYGAPAGQPAYGAPAYGQPPVPTGFERPQPIEAPAMPTWQPPASEGPAQP